MRLAKTKFQQAERTVRPEVVIPEGEAPASTVISDMVSHVESQAGDEGSIRWWDARKKFSGFVDGCEAELGGCEEVPSAVN